MPKLSFPKGALADFFADMLSFLLLSCGMTLALLYTIPQGGTSVVFTALCLLAAYLLYSALLHKWYVPVAVLLLAAAALGIAWWAFHGTAAEFWQPVTDFSQWAYKYWIGSAEELPTGSIRLFTFLSALLVALPCFLFVRKVRFLPVVYLMPAALFLWLWLSGYSQIFWFLTISFLGVLMLTARAYAWRCMRSGGKMEGQVSAAAMQLWTLPLLLLVLGVCQLCLPQDTDAIRTPFFEQKAADLNDLLFQYTNFTRPRTSFSIRSTGLMPLSSRLGGPIEEQSDDIRLIVYANMDYDLYLRGNIRNWYTGQKWLDAGVYRQYRFNSSLWTEERLDLFDLNRPTHRTETSPNYEQRLYRRLNLTIVPQDTTNYSTILSAGRVMELNAKNEKQLLIYFDEQGETFSLRNVPPYAAYSLTVGQTDRSLSRFDETIHKLIDMEEEEASDTPEKTAHIQAYYLHLPDELPQSVYDAAQEAVKDLPEDADRYDKAVALENYLKTNFTYTLTPEVPPENSDFIDYFLQTGEGYCTYFATSMTIMARTLGIPSRYVEGYLCSSSNYNKKIDGYYLRDKNAHAWVEIYFDGIGWVTFDPTPAIVEEKEPQTNSLGGETQSLIPTPTPAPTAAPTETPEPAAEESRPFPLWIPAAALAALLLLILLSFKIYADRSRMASVERRLPDPGQQADWYFRRIVRQLLVMDISYYRGDTLRAFMRRADHDVGIVPGTFEEIADIMDPYRYADRKPNEDQIEFLAEMQQELARESRRTCHWPKFLFRCIWFPPRWNARSAPMDTNRKEIVI